MCASEKKILRAKEKERVAASHNSYEYPKTTTQIAKEQRRSM
jgi:hypothetical protein